MPIVVNGDLYLAASMNGSYTGSVFALRTRDGKPVWRYQTRDTVNQLFADQGGIFFSTGDLVTRPTYYALDAATGHLRWRIQPSSLFGAPQSDIVAATRSYLYVRSGDDAGGVYALRASDGKQVWYSNQCGTPEQIGKVPQTPVNGVLYFLAISNYSSELMALRVSDNVLVWCDDFADVTLGSPTATAGGVFVQVLAPPKNSTAVNAGLLALRLSDGKQLWFKPTGHVDPLQGQLGGDPPIVSKAVVAADVSSDGSIVAWRATDGQPLWRIHPMSLRLGPAFVGTALVYADDVSSCTAAHDGPVLSFHGLNAQTGQETWHTTIALWDDCTYLSSALGVDSSVG